METHPSHVTRVSDSSLYDEKCINCGATDSPYNKKGSLSLENPCPKPVEKGGITFEEWREKRRKKLEQMEL